MAKFILISFLIWRILLFIPLFASEQFLPYRTGYEYTKPPVSSFLLYPWANFDGVHYLSIAGQGYQNNERFFPLYPLLIKALSFAGPFFIAFTIANIAFLASLFVMYKLIRLDYSNKIASSTILFVLIFPTSFFFASLYSESLFLALSLLSFLAARKRKWFLVGVLGMLTSATRIVGILLLPALLYEFFKNEKDRRKIISLFAAPLGILGYAIFNFLNFGNPLQFLTNQQEVANSRELFVFPLQTMVRYLKIVTTLPLVQFEWWIALLEISTFILVTILFVVAWKKKIRLTYLIFAALCFLLPVWSGTFSGLPRYSIILFPIFIALVLIKNRVVKNLYIVVSPILLFLLLMFFSKGYFIA